MRGAKQNRQSFLKVLLARIAHRIARALAAMSPVHDAGAAVAIVVRRGNPSGE